MNYEIGDHARHGDILPIRIEALPEGATPIPTRPLAYGEVTGHSHKLDADLGAAEMFERDGTLYFRLKELASVVHDEHNRLPLAPGIYEVRIQREYVPQSVPSKVRD